MAKDLTRGNPLKIILLFSIPLAIGNACNQLYTMVDLMIVGRWCGPDKLAAIGNAGSVIFMLLGFFWGLPAGFTIITGQRFGAKDAPGVRRSFCASVVLCSALVAAVTLVFLAYLRPILVAMKTPDNILEDSLKYLRIIVAGTPSMTFYLLMSFLMRSLGDSKRPLYVIVFSSFLNAGLDLLLVCKFNLDVAGAAYATVFSQLISGLICLGIILKKFPELLPAGRSDWRIDWRFYWEHLRVAVPMALQFSVTGLGCVILQSAFNQFGSGTVAATTAAGRLEGLICIPFFAIGTTLAAYTAQNSGATFVYTRQQLPDTHLCLVAAVHCINSKAALHLQRLKLRYEAVYIFELVAVGVIREREVSDNLLAVVEHPCREYDTVTFRELELRLVDYAENFLRVNVERCLIFCHKRKAWAEAHTIKS